MEQWPALIAPPFYGHAFSCQVPAPKQPHTRGLRFIVNEILVMKESQHPNIVNFLESYLVKSQELWVVMEYMEGGALTDIIENNSLAEDQISSICLEVRCTPQPRYLPVP